MSVILTTTELVDALDGDLLSAIMLHQIRYWCSADEFGVSRLRVRRGDQLWLVKSHQDWWNELRLTRQQSRKCLDTLRDRKLVHTEVHRFNGVPTLHIRLVAENQSIGCQEPNALVASSQSITETTQKTTAETTMATAKDVMMGFEKPKTAEAKLVTPSYLGMVWKQRTALVTGQFVKSLTIADVGKLKHVLKGCGEQALPAMVFAIENWHVFKSDVWAKKGETGNPSLPEIGFFVKHYDVAVQLIAQTKHPESPAVQTGGIAPTVVPGDNPEPQVSAEDVLNDLAVFLQKAQTKD